MWPERMLNPEVEFSHDSMPDMSIFVFVFSLSALSVSLKEKQLFGSIPSPPPPPPPANMCAPRAHLHSHKFAIFLESHAQNRQRTGSKANLKARELKETKATSGKKVKKRFRSGPTS